VAPGGWVVRIGPDRPPGKLLGVATDVIGDERRYSWTVKRSMVRSARASTAE